MATNSRMERNKAAERHWSLSRRQFLRGVGASIALPTLPSLVPHWAQAAELTSGASAAASAATAVPLRMMFVTIPNGVHQDNWWPSGEGKKFELGPTMEPLAAVKDQIQVIAGLDHINATAGPDGAGDHARASATLLTGCRAKKTAGSDIYVGPSVDQIAAGHVGHLSRFPSLELTCDAVRNSGSCDSGYACAYQFNISWRTATTPAPPEPNPRLVFERMFGEGSREERARSLARRQERERSILDFIRDDARELARKLDAKDNRKLDEYLTSVREIEARIARLERFGDLPNPNVPTPEGVPEQFESHMELMYDMVALAFETDMTRIATLILSHDGSNRPFPMIDINRGHHDLSHHQGNEDNLKQIARIDRHYMTYFAKFLEKLASQKDADGNSILHNSMIVYAGGNADGNAHTHDNLPVIVAGAGGGSLQPGRFHEVRSMPMANMYLEMLDHMGVKGITNFGDADGRRAVI